MAERGRLRAALTSGPILLDAGMGTRLIARGLRLDDDDPCLWVLDRSEDVLDVHRLDVNAGSDAILTNTFGANASWLARFGRARDADRINSLAASIARDAAGPDRLVLGDLGPSGLDDPPSYRRQALNLVESGVDGLILETHSPDQARAGLALIRDEVFIPILVGLYRWEIDIHRRLRDLGASAVGVNCLTLSGAIAALGPLIADDPGPWLVKASPDPEFPDPEAWAEALIALGAGVLGGCCGTTEAHVEALRRRIPRREQGDAPSSGPRLVIQ